jgi:hypothetical protein
LGEPAQLLQELNGIVPEDERRSKLWPQNARALGHSLRRLAPALRRSGINLERDKGTRRTIRLCNAGKRTAVTSATSAAEEMAKDNEDVLDDVFPQLHDPLINEALKLFNGKIVA